MFGKKTQLQELENIHELTKKEESRKCIRETHDAVIALRIESEFRKKEFDEHRLSEDKVFARHEEIFKDISSQIENHTCMLSKETKAIVDALIKRADEQNGHIAEVVGQVTLLAADSKEVLTIAKGRKSLWKDAAAVTGSTIGVLGFIAAIVLGIIRLMK